MRDYNTILMTFLCTQAGLTPGASGAKDLTTFINRYLATLTGDMTNRWRQMEKNAGLA